MSLIIKENQNKQIIIVTHDSKKLTYNLMDNIIYFSKSQIYSVNKLFEKYTAFTNNNNINLNSFKKKLYENKTIFFEQNILCVEGPSDLKVMNIFCEKYEINTYVISISGCASVIPDLCIILEKNVKCIYDLDFIFKSLGEKALYNILINDFYNKNNENIKKNGEISSYKLFLYNEKFIDIEMKKKYDLNKLTFNDIGEIRKEIMDKNPNIYFHTENDLTIEGFLNINDKNINDLSMEIIESEIDKKDFTELIDFLK
jgi:energy-coupling factor transporter ATP-binding protein EcfA2